MNEIAKINIAEKQLVELETAIAKGDYSAFNKLLAHQALTLHVIGMDYMKKSEEASKLVYKQACMDIALKSFSQSVKTIKLLRAKR